MVGISCAVCRTVQQTHYTLIKGTGLCNRCADSYQGTNSRLALGRIQKMINPDPKFKDYGPINWKYFFDNDCQFSKENMAEINSAIKKTIKEKDDKVKARKKEDKEKQDYVDKPMRRRDLASKQVPNEKVTIQREESEPATYTNVDRTVTKDE